MQFSNLYKSPKSPLSRLIHQTPQHLHTPDCDWDPDFFSRDKEKQKSAVQRYLKEKVRTDWDFEWPPPNSDLSSPRESTSAQDDAEAAEIAASAATAADEAENTAGAEKTAVGNDDDNVNSGLAGPSATIDAPHQEEPEGTGPDMHALADPASHSATGCCQASRDGTRTTESRDPGYDADSGESDVESVYSTVSEDLVRFRPRTEWESGEETDDDEISYASSPIRLRSPYRFDNPDSVGEDIVARTMQKKAEKRRELRKEMKWNDGLACFQARRDVWTGAKTVRVKPPVQPQSPREEKHFSPLSPRRLFMRGGSSIPSSPVAGAGGILPLSLHPSQSSGDSGDGEAVFSVRETTSKDTNASSTDENDASAAAAAAAALTAKNEARKRFPVVTLLPNPPPLLPPENPMRASITPSTYSSIFERIVMQGMTPSCPVNLGDMVSACVAGWKRRGEWPPRLTAPEPNFSRRRANTHNVRTQQQQQQQAVAGVGMVPVIQSPGTRKSLGTKAATTSTAPAVQPPCAVPASPPPPPPPPKSEARRKSFSFLTREKSKDKDKSDGKEEDGVGAGKTFRRSLQRVFGWHPHHIRGGSMDGLASPMVVAKTDPAPAVLNPETVHGRGSQDGRVSPRDAIGNQRVSGEARSLGSGNPRTIGGGERATEDAPADPSPNSNPGLTVGGG